MVERATGERAAGEAVDGDEGDSGRRADAEDQHGKAQRQRGSGEEAGGEAVPAPADGEIEHARGERGDAEERGDQHGGAVREAAAFEQGNDGQRKAPGDDAVGGAGKGKQGKGDAIDRRPRPGLGFLRCSGWPAGEQQPVDRGGDGEDEGRAD